MAYKIKEHTDPKAFLDRAESWLMQSEAEYNLLIGLARTLVHSSDSFEKPIFLATIEMDDEIKGCAFRTPPYKLGLTQMPLEAIDALLARVRLVYDDLPAVLGPEPEARKFAELWSGEREIEMREGMRQRIFQLSEVVNPLRPAPGKMVLAESQHLDLVGNWIGAFQVSTGLQIVDARDRAKELIDGQKVFLWIDQGEAVAMAGGTGGTENGIRIAYVYTPAHNRRKGYATTLTAALSQKYLDSGKRFCFLYTDLSNPTANSIYQKIGYRPVSDVIDYFFDLEKV